MASALEDSAQPASGGEIPPLTTATRYWYGLGQGAEGIKNQAFTLFLLFYYTQVLGLSGSLAGLAVALALVFDAVSDPLTGVLSDRLDSRWGRRHPFLYASALPLAVAFTLVFTPPAGLGQAGLFGWLLCFAVLTRAAMTLYHVPHLALGAELSSSYHERTRIVAARTLFREVGQLLTGAGALLYFMRPTPGFENGQLNPAAYPPFAATFGVVMLLTILASAAATHHRIPYLPGPDRQHRNALTGLLRGTAQAFRQRSFRALFFGSTLIFAAFGVSTALSLYMATYFWRVTTDQMFLFGIFVAIGIFGGLAFWPRVAARHDKRPTFLIGLVLFAAFVSLPILFKVVGFFPAEDSVYYLPAWFVHGFGYAFGLTATMVTGGSMMADVADADELQHGGRHEGIFFGAVSFTSKASVGIGAFVAGQVVDRVGLVRGMQPDDVAPEMVRMLGLVDGLALLLIVTAALVAFSRYDLTRERHASIRAQLDARREAPSLR